MIERRSPGLVERGRIDDFADDDLADDDLADDRSDGAPSRLRIDALWR
jgi:hypothetical protein